MGAVLGGVVDRLDEGDSSLDRVGPVAPGAAQHPVGPRPPGDLDQRLAAALLAPTLGLFPQLHRRYSNPSDAYVDHLGLAW